MDRRRAAGVLLALAACFACSAAAPTASNQTALDLYEGGAGGCYYNFQHYGEGDRIMTNEPCLNCTCHNKMLMCYLRVCPFTKAIGQDCTVEKRADQCCPIVTCPDVPVDLLTSTSTTSPAEYGATGVGKVDKYGCSISGKYFPEGSKVPPTPNKPCEHCYCIRNMTTCVMQECTLHVDGCTPIYHKDVCCPVRYSCDHPEDEMLLLDDMSTTVRPTPGFLLTTTTASPVTQMTQDCVHDEQIFADGTSIQTEKPCEHCYCMKGDIVCVVQECGTPMENEGKNCTSLPPREGQCCPDTYICEGDVISTDSSTEPTTEIISDKLTTLLPPMRGGVEGSGYRLEPDELPTVAPTESEFEGSGDEKDTTNVFEPVTSEKPTSAEDELPALQTDDNKTPDSVEPEKTTETHQVVSELDTQTPQTYITSTTPKKEDFEKLTTSEITEEEILAPHDRLSTSAPTDESYEGATTEISEPLTTDSDKKQTISSDSTSAAYKPESETTTFKQVDDLEEPISTGSLTTTPSAENLDKIDRDSSALPEIVTPSSVTTQDESMTPVDYLSPQEHEQLTTTEKDIKEIASPSSEIYGTSTSSTLDKGTTEPDHAENTIAVAEEDNTPSYNFAPSTTTKSVLEEEDKHSTTALENDVTESTGDKEALKPSPTTENTINEVKITTEEPDKGLNTIPNEIDEEATLGSLLPTTAAAVELKTTESSMFELSSKVPEIMSTRGEQFTVTTEPSFRKEDDIIVSTEKPKEATTVKPEFIDDGLIPTSSQDDRYNTGSEVSHTEDDVTTSIPEFVEFTEPTESYPQTSIIPDQVSEITGKPEYEIPSSTEKPDDVSAFIPVVTETHDEGSRIPGEGDCLLEGITYRNNTVVPSSNNCHAGCKCVSSIIKCDPIICSPPPSYNGNCQTIYDSPDACCPTYVCDHPRETVPPQSDNQMSGTESPMSRPSIECDGDQCEIIPPKQQHPEPSCGPEGCGADTQKPDALEPSYKEPTECAGDNCTPSSHTIPHKQQHPEPSCGPEGCGADTQKPDALEPSYKEPTECAGDNCTPSSHTIPPKQQHPEPSCGPEGCGMDIQKPDALEPSYKEPTECAGDNCTPSSHTIPPKQQHPEPSCGPEGCDAETQKPDALEPSHKEPTECAGDNCTPSSHPIPPKQQHPEPSCGPEGCGADTQKPDALEPSHKEPTECAGDNCTPSSHPIPPKQQHPEPSCGPEGCGADTQKPDALEPSHKEPTVCAGDNCTPSSQDCSGSGCQLPTSEGHEQPTQPCEGEACKAALQPTLPGLQDSAAVPCEGDSCHKVDCAGSDCEPDHIAYPMDTKDITSDDCNGEVPCRRKETPPNNAYLPAKCEGSDCVKETEITTAHSVDSSTLKQTPLEIATEIPTEQPRYPTSDITTERVKEMPTVVDVNVEVTETPERKPDLSIPTEASLVPLPDDGVTHPAEKEQENKEPVEDSQKPTDSNITGEPELHTNPPPVDKEFTKPVSFEDENKPYSTSSDDDNITKEDKLGMTEPTIEVKNVTHDLMDVGELTTVSPMLIEEYSTLTPPKENTGKPEIEDFERQTSPAIEEKSTIKPDDVDDKTESYVTAYENTEKSTVTEDIRTEPNEAMSSSKPVEILTERPTIVEQQEHKEPSTDRIDVSSEKDRYPEDSNEITTPRATEGILETEDTLVPAGVSTQKPEVEQEEEHKTTNVYDQDVTKPDEEPVTIIETVTDKPIGVSITDIPSTDEKEYSTQGLDFVVPSSTDKIDLEKDNMGESIESSTKPSLSSEIENSPKPDVVGDKVPEKSTEGHSDAETEPTIIQTEGPSITGVEETTKPFIIDESKDQEITPSGATESDKPIPSDEKPIDGEIPQIFENESTEMPASAVTTQQGISADSVDDITTIISVVDKKDTPVDIENQTEKPTDVTVHEKDAEHKDKPATDQDIIVNVGDSIKENDSTEEPSITENKDIEKPIVDDLKKPILINEEDKEVTTGVTESSSSTESIDDKNKETIMPDKEKPLIITDATDKPIIRDDDTKTTSTDVGEPGTDAAIDKEVENGNKPLTDKLDEKDVPKPLGEKETETIAPTIITEKPQELDTPEEGSGSDSHLPEDLSKPKLTTEPTIEHETNIPEKISTVGIEQSPSEAAQAPQMTTDSQKEAPVREDGLQKTTELNELEITTKPQDVYMSSAADEVTNSPLTVPTIASHKEETISDEKMNEVSTELPQTEVTFVIDTRDQGAGYTTEKSKITNALPDSQETYVTVEPSELLNKPDKDLGDGENKEPGRPESSTEKEEILPESTTPDATKPAQSYTEEEGSKMTSPIEDVTAVPEKSPESVVTQKANEDLDIANTTPRSPEKPISDTDLEYATTLPSVDKQTLKPTESAPTEHFTNADSQTQDTSETVGYTASEEKTTSKPDLMEEEKPITEIPQQQITESDESNTVSDSGNLQTTKEELVPTITDKSPIDVSSTSPKEETKVTIPESVTEQYDEPHDLVTKSPVEVSTVLNEMPSVEPSDHITSEAPLSLVTEGEVKPTEQIYVPVEPERTEVPVVVTESELQPERMPQDEKITERPAEDTLGEIVTSKPETQTESSTDKPYVDSVLPEITTTKLIEDMAKPTDSTIQAEFSETTPYLIELEEHSHKIQDDNLTPTSEETSLPDEQLSTISPHNVNQDQSVVPETGTEIQPSVSTQKSIESETELGSITTESPRLPSEESSQLPAEQDKESDGIHDSLTSTTSKTVLVTEETTLVTTPQGSAESSTETILSEQAPSETEKPKEPIVPHENVTPEEEFIFATTKATTIKQEDEPQTQQSDDKFTKPEESEVPHPPPSIPEVTKPGDIQPTDEVPSPEEEGHFPPSGSSGYGEPDYPEEDQAFGPGTCRYGGKVYVSAQQIPRDDPCDFCFCFRSDIICLQQSCPPPIHGCHEEPIQGFCCPRYECPVSMATSVNVTTTTTTTTTTLPPHFLAHAYKGAAQRRGCQIKGHTYKVGEVVRSSSGPCLHCTCGGDGQMKCDPKACTPEPMLRQMIAAAVSAKRRR